MSLRIGDIAPDFTAETISRWRSSTPYLRYVASPEEAGNTAGAGSGKK